MRLSVLDARNGLGDGAVPFNLGLLGAVPLTPDELDRLAEEGTRALACADSPQRSSKLSGAGACFLELAPAEGH